ncbi:MAG: hypothetical protein V4494_00800 [Chlamydiota bacterium]
MSSINLFADVINSKEVVSLEKPLESLSSEKVIQLSLNMLSTQSIIISSPREITVSFPKSRFLIQSADYQSVMEFTKGSMRRLTQANIDKIKNIDKKLCLLKDAVKNQRWTDSLFDVTNIEFEGIEHGEYFEFPFVALYGLEKGIISHEEFFLIQSYYGLRAQFNKEDIAVHSIFDETGSINKEIEKRLRECLCENLFFGEGPNDEEEVGRTSLNFSEEKFQEFLEKLKSQPNLHEMILFSIPQKEAKMNEEEAPTVWEAIRGQVGFRVFCNETTQYVPSLGTYTLFLRTLYPHSQDVQLKVRIDFTPNQEQRRRAEGFFDVLVPFPTCFPLEADQFDAPGLEGMFHDLFYHALIIFGIPSEIRETLYKIAGDLRDCENKLSCRFVDNSLRYQISNEVFDTDLFCLVKFPSKRKENSSYYRQFKERSDAFQENVTHKVEYSGQHKTIIKKLRYFVRDWNTAMRSYRKWDELAVDKPVRQAFKERPSIEMIRLWLVNNKSNVQR